MSGFTPSELANNLPLQKAKVILAMKFGRIKASSKLDSRGIPTVKVELEIKTVRQIYKGSGYAPSGASTGVHEALELRDNDESHYHGKGVSKAIKNVNETIAKALITADLEFDNLRKVDDFLINLDGSDNKSVLGANALCAFSLATARAIAASKELELYEYLNQEFFSNTPISKLNSQDAYQGPIPMSNVINGGVHADSGLSVQEFMVVPETGRMDSVIEGVSTLYQDLKSTLHKDGFSIALGDEGGFAPKLKNTKTVIEYLEALLKKQNHNSANYRLALDVAASEFYDAGKNLYTIDGLELSSQELVNFYKEIVENHNIFSLEDPLAEDDIEGWKLITQELGDKIMLVGDDLFVTNLERFKSIGLGQKIGNAILIKFNQIGTITETCDVINLAKANNYKIIISHRSGETIDTFISDLAFACQADFIKLGATARGERVAKYNRLLEISELIDEKTFIESG